MTCSPFSRVSGMLGSLVSALFLACGQAGAQAPLPDYQLQPAGPHQVTAGFGKSSELALTLGNASSTQSAAWKLVFEGNAASGLPGVLESLDSHSADLFSVIPDRYLFGEGTTGSEISDGGGDMYDGGNMLSAGGTTLVYSNGAVISRTIGTGSVSYFTRKLSGLFVMAADFTGVDNFAVTGNLGADGSGQITPDEFTLQSAGVTYRGYVTRVHGAGDPSINQLILVPSKAGLARTHAVGTSSENHRVTGLGTSSRVYYLLFAKDSGGFYATSVFQDLARNFLQTVGGGPSWASGNPAQGSVAAGGSGPVRIALDGLGLDPGTYPTRFAVVPQAMEYNQIPPASFQDLSFTIQPPGFTVAGGDRTVTSLAGIAPPPLDVALTPATAGTTLSGLQVSSSASWLQASVGSTANTVRLTFNSAALVAGTHIATINVGDGETQTSFRVSLTVASLNVTRLLPDPARPRIYAINGNGQEIGSLLVIDSLTRSIVRNVPLGKKPTDLDIGDGGNTLFAINAVDQTIQEINLATFEVARTHTLSSANYSNWGQVETHAHVRAGKGDILYYVDGQWGPRLRVFNRATGQVLQTFGASSTGTSNDDGIGALSLTPDGSAIFTTMQYGWSAGSTGTYLGKFQVNANGTLTYQGKGASGASANFQRDPLDTPVIVTSDGTRVVAKDRVSPVSDVTTVSTIYPDEIYSVTPRAEIAIGSKSIYAGLGGEILHTLPVTTTVQTITPDYRYLVYFNATAKSLAWLDLIDTLGMQTLGLVIQPQDGATVAQPNQLQWLPITGVSRYQVYYGTDRTSVENGTPSSGTYLGETTDSRFTLPSVPAPGQTFYWRIVPIGEDGLPSGTGITRSFFVAPLTLSRSSINAETVEGVERHVETITLGAATATAWSATADVPWISFDANSGSTPGNLSAVFNASALTVGYHSGKITVTSDGVSFQVPVTLRVHAANFMIAESDLELPWVYAISQASNSATTTSFLLRINTATDRIESAVPCGRSVTDLAIHYAENRIYLTNWQTGILRAFDRGTFKQVQTYQFSPVGPIGYGEGGIWRVAAGKAGRLILEESDQWIDIRLINTANGAVVASNSSEYAGDGEADPTGRYYYHSEGLSSSDSMVRFDLNADSFVAMTPTATGQGTSVVMIGDGSKVTSGARVYNSQLGLLFTLPSEVKAGTLHGDLLFAANKAYNGSTGLEIATLPITAPVMSVTGDQEKLYLFPANSRTFRTVDLSDIAQLPPRAITPTIADGSTVNGTSQSLAWTLEPFALSYRVYFGTDRDAVTNATESSPQYLGSSPTNSWSGALPPLALGGNYFWRVDTVGFSGTVRGSAWSFRVAPLALAPGKLDVTLSVSSPVESRTLAISGPAGSEWSASTTMPWLSVVNSSGTVPGNVELRINPAGLATGIRLGSVRFQSGANAWDIPVSLELLALNYTMAKADLDLPYIYAISQAASGTDDRAFMVVIDTRTNLVAKVVPVGRSVTDLSVHYQENRIYLSNWQSGKLIALDRTTLQEVRSYTYQPAGATGYSSGDVYKVAAGRSGRLIFEEQDQWVDFFMIDTATGNKVATGHAREGGGVFDPAGRYYFHGENNSSGAALVKFDTAGDTMVQKASKRVESFSYYGSRRVLASGDGSRVYWNGGVFDPDLNVRLLLTDEVVAATYRGEVIFTDDGAFNGVSGERLATLPVTTAVQGVSSDQRKLFLFKAGAFSVVDIASIANVPPRGLVPGIAHGSTVIGTSQELSWSQEATALSYDVYFGSSADAVATATKSSPAYLGNVTGTRWTGALPTLALGTSYWWRVDIVGFGSVVTPGAVWTFGIAPVDVVPRALDLAFPTGSPVPRQQLALTAGAPTSWTASTTTPWISLVGNSGTTPGSLQFDINTAGLATGLKEGSITLQSGGTTFSVPVKLRVLALNVTKLVAHPTRPVVYGINTAAAGEGFSHLLEIDATTANILRSLPIGFGPTDADLDPVGERLYVSNWQFSHTRVIDVAAWTELPSLALGDDVYKLEITPRGKLITEEQDQWIGLQLWNAATGAKISTTGSSVREGDGEADPTGNFYYHCDNNISNAHVTKYDISADTFVEVAEGPQLGYGSRNLILSKDGSRLFWQGRVMDPDLKVLGVMPSEVHATTANGTLAIGGSQVWWSDSGMAAATLPFDSTVAAVSSNDAYLLRFNATTKKLVSTAISSIADIPGPWPRPSQVLDQSPERLSWSPVAGATAYRLFIAGSASELAGMTTPTATVTTTFYDLANPLAYGKSYTWRVDAVTPSGTTTGKTQSFGVRFPAGPALATGTTGSTSLYGIAASMSHRRILIGTDGRNAQLLDFDPATGATSPLQTMSVPDLSYSDNFGATVASDGDKAMVGSSSHDTPLDDAGAAFVFRPDVYGYWTHGGALSASTPAQYGNFGTGLAASGNLMLAGTGGSNVIGRVEAYITEPDTVRTQSFTAADGVVGDGFGRLIVMEGNDAIIASTGRGPSYDRLPVLYAFTRSTSTGLWTQTQKIAIPGASTYEATAAALALSGNTLACHSKDGAAIVIFSKGGNGLWTQSATINRSSVTGSSSYSTFGQALAIAGDVLFVGDQEASANGLNNGAVFSFRRSGNTWQQGPTVVSGDDSYGNFGADLVARDGWLLVTGGPSTTAKLFRTDAGANSIPAFLTGTPTQVVAGRSFSTRIEAEDADGNEGLIFDKLQGPDWFTVGQGDEPGSGLLSGTPEGNSGEVHVVQLRVRDAAGAQSLYTYRLTLLAETDVPVLTLEPVGGDAGEGQELTLRAAVSGIGPFSWQWFRDGEELAGQTRATLNLGEVALSDSGSYTVRVSNIVGSDTSAPAVIEVHPANRFAGNWPTFGGNTRHTGYHPARLGRHTFMPAWTRQVNASVGLHRAAIAEGKVFVSSDGWFENGASLQALSLADGAPLWSSPIPYSSSVNPPTWHNGTVYFQRGKGTSDTLGPQLIALDAATGANRWSTTFGAQWESYEAPAVTDDGIWINGGTYGGMYGYSPAGTQRFFRGLDQYDGWTPTVSQGRLFSWVAGLFQEHNPLDGSTLWSVNAGWDWHGWTMNTVSAVSGNSAVVFSTTEMVCIDLASRSIRWRRAGAFHGSPAISGGRVYGIRGQAVESFSLADGTPGPVVTLPAAIVSQQPLLLMDRLVVATETNTYLIDPANSALVRTLPGGGLLSYSQGYLLVAGANGQLRAWYANGAPEFSAEFPVLVDAGAAAAPVQLPLAEQVSDIDPGETLTWSLVSVSNPQLFNSIGIDPATGVLSVVYNPWTEGSSIATIAVVDSAGNRTETAITFTLPVHPDPELLIGTEIVLNRQTGLYEQTVKVTNAGEREIGGFEIQVGGLPAGVLLKNTASVSGGVWTISHQEPVAAGATVTYVLTYYTPLRGTVLSPQVSASLVVPGRVPAPPAASVAVVPGDPGWKIDQFERLADGALVLGFPAVPGATYEVQYSDDLANWKQVPTRILATGDRVSWTDRGAPDTERHPSAESARFYRIEKIESAGN